MLGVRREKDGDSGQSEEAVLVQYDLGFPKVCLFVLCGWLVGGACVYVWREGRDRVIDRMYVTLCVCRVSV